MASKVRYSFISFCSVLFSVFVFVFVCFFVFVFCFVFSFAEHPQRLWGLVLNNALKLSDFNISIGHYKSSTDKIFLARNLINLSGVKVCASVIIKVRIMKSTWRTKRNVASQEQSLLKWQEHFKKLLGNPLEITDKPIQKIIKDQ